MVFESNLVVCPSCNNSFVNNRVNGLALIEAVNHIESRKRMYCKLALDSLEKLDNGKALSFSAIKKIILDDFNDFNRDIQTILGIGQEVE